MRARLKACRGFCNAKLKLQMAPELDWTICYARYQDELVVWPCWDSARHYDVISNMRALNYDYLPQSKSEALR